MQSEKVSTVSPLASSVSEPSDEHRQEPSTAGKPSGGRRVPWVGVVAAVLLLTASAGVRAWQSWGVDEALRQGLVSPFPLSRLPKDLGDWKGETREIDPEIRRQTGCTDAVFRSYRNEKTGSRIDLILLYGPATEVILHAPLACYPSAGFQTVVAPESRVVHTEAGDFLFSSIVFAKDSEAQPVYEEVYYTWGAVRPGEPDVNWTANMGLWKQIERIPGLYKVHLQRIISPVERREFGNPCEAFLKELMPWIDRQYKATLKRPGGGGGLGTVSRTS